MNSMFNNICLFVLMFIASAIFCFANYYAKLPNIGNNFTKVFLISMGFVIFEYCFKLPAIWYFGKEINSVVIYSLNLICIFISLIFFNKFVLKEDIPVTTYVSLFLIIAIIVANNAYINKIKPASKK
jgi:uncharacterized protein (DUF486 family)